MRQARALDPTVWRNLKSDLSIVGLIPRGDRQIDIESVDGICEGANFDATPSSGGALSAWRPRPRRDDIERGICRLSSGICSCFGEIYDRVGRRYSNLSHKRRIVRKRAWIKGAIKSNTRWWVRPSDVDLPVLALTASTSDMYFHWLLDVLPRFYIARQAGHAQRRWLYVASRHPFQRETLAALDLLGRTINPCEHPLIRVNDLLIPSHQLSCGHLPSPWVLQFLRAELRPRLQIATRRFSRRLYISREDAARRVITNENEIMKRLSPLGFEKITLSDLRVSEQVAAFANAEIIIGAHGSGFANFAFCAPHTTAIELFPNDYYDDGPYRVAYASNLNYYYVRARKKTTRGLAIEANYRIEVDDIMQTIELARADTR